MQQIHRHRQPIHALSVADTLYASKQSTDTKLQHLAFSENSRDKHRSCNTQLNIDGLVVPRATSLSTQLLLDALGTIERLHMSQHIQICLYAGYISVE